jgi:hypothetical protein
MLGSPFTAEEWIGVGKEGWLKLVMQDDAEEGAVNLQSAVVMNEA